MLQNVRKEKMQHDALIEKIIERLKGIYDPEIPVNLFDLGLIYNIECTQKGDITQCVITMTLTSPSCPVSEDLLEQVRDIAYFIEGEDDLPEDADDASQETFTRILSQQDTAKLDSPTGYIWRTAQNLAKEIRRTRILHSKWMSSGAVDFDNRVSQEPDPDEVMKTKEMNDKILDLLNQLPPRCREVFILHRFKGLPHKQIAKKLNISTKTVENHMVNALLFFHKHLPLS